MDKKTDLITFLSRSLKNRNKRIDYEDSFIIDILKGSFFSSIWDSACTVLEIKPKNYINKGYCCVNLQNIDTEGKTYTFKTFYYDKYEAFRVISLILLAPTEKQMREKLKIENWRIYTILNITRKKRNKALSDYPDGIQRILFSILNVSDADAYSIHPFHFMYGAIFNPVVQLKRNNDDDNDSFVPDMKCNGDQKTVHQYTLPSSVGTPFNNSCNNHILKLNLFIAMVVATQMPTSDITKSVYILDVVPFVIKALKEPKRLNEHAKYLEPINNKEGWLSEMCKLVSFGHKDSNPDRHKISLRLWEAASALPNEIDFVRRNWYMPYFEVKQPVSVKIEHISQSSVIECLKLRPCPNIIRRDIAIHQENLFTSVTLPSAPTDQKLSVVYLKIDNTSQVALFDLWSRAFTKFSKEKYLFSLLHYVWARSFVSQTNIEQTIVITYQFVFDIINCFVYKYNNHVNQKSVSVNGLNMLIARTASISLVTKPLFKETGIFDKTFNELLYLIIEGPMYEHAFCRDAKDSRDKLIDSLKRVVCVQFQEWYPKFSEYVNMKKMTFEEWHKAYQDDIRIIFRLWRSVLASSRNIKFKNNTNFIDKLLTHMGETCVSGLMNKLVSKKMLEEVRLKQTSFTSWWKIITRVCKGSEPKLEDESNGWALMRMSSSCTYIDDEDEEEEKKRNDGDIPGVPDYIEKDGNVKLVPSFPRCTDRWFESEENIFCAYICMINVCALICAVDEADHEVLAIEDDFVALVSPDHLIPLIRNKKQIVMGHINQRPFYSDDMTMTNQPYINNKYYNKELYPFFRVWGPGENGKKKR